MRVLIAGGRGFLGSALERALIARGHEVQVLTRGISTAADEIHWDGKSPGPWTASLESVDAVVNACGYGLEHWPWSAAKKREFFTSRVDPGRALTAAISEARPRPSIFVQFSGINRYGLIGTDVADETTPAADDFLAQLTVEWEAATQPAEVMGVRRIVVRAGIVLDRTRGLLPLMSLPSRLFVGGRLGTGRQAVPWIHVNDLVRAIQHLIQDERASGAYNLVSPQPTANAEFMEAVCRTLRRPYWMHVPAFSLRLALGAMSDLVVAGRPSAPRRLLQAGFEYDFPSIQMALQNLLGG